MKKADIYIGTREEILKDFNKYEDDTLFFSKEDRTLFIKIGDDVVGPIIYG